MVEPTVLKVVHFGEAKMVGKCFIHEGRRIFLHEEVGTQQHIGTGAPGGVDKVALEWLLEGGWDEYHHHNRANGNVYITMMESFQRDGELQTAGGRTRWFLPPQFWTKQPGGLWYRVPWIDREVVLDPKKVARKT